MYTSPFKSSSRQRNSLLEYNESAKGTNGTNGTNGTDVGTTNNNTRRYTLQRWKWTYSDLPKGTAGQVLKMNSSANAPEYGTLSSDYVKVASVEATSGSKVSFNNVFATGTYKSYVINISRFIPSGATWIKFYWRDSGTDVTSNYYWITIGEYGSSSATSEDRYKAWNGSYGVITYWSVDNSYNLISKIHVGNPAITTKNKVIYSDSALMTQNEIFRCNSAFSNHNSTVNNGCDGFSLELANTSYSITNMDVEVYGIK